MNYKVRYEIPGQPERSRSGEMEHLPPPEVREVVEFKNGMPVEWMVLRFVNQGLEGEEYVYALEALKYPSGLWLAWLPDAPDQAALGGERCG